MKDREHSVGHASITTQLDWCAKAGVRGVLFSHCARAIVAGRSSIEARIAGLGRARGIDARIAHDSLTIILR
jgi:hypothetical protein